MLRIPPHRTKTMRWGPRILPLVMRARIFLCITLLYLCHPQLWPQAVTKQFPPAPAAAAGSPGTSPVTPSDTPSSTLPDAPDGPSDIPVARVVPAPPTGVPVEIH